MAACCIKNRLLRCLLGTVDRLYEKLAGKFYGAMEAVGEALKATPKTSSTVENLDSHLRNYLFLRRNLGDSYLSTLQFF